jgi:hypothetical protein
VYLLFPLCHVPYASCMYPCLLSCLCISCLARLSFLCLSQSRISVRSFLLFNFSCCCFLVRVSRCRTVVAAVPLVLPSPCPRHTPTPVVPPSHFSFHYVVL